MQLLRPAVYSGDGGGDGISDIASASSWNVLNWVEKERFGLLSEFSKDNFSRYLHNWYLDTSSFACDLFFFLVVPSCHLCSFAPVECPGAMSRAEAASDKLDLKIGGLYTSAQAYRVYMYEVLDTALRLFSNQIDIQ